MDYRLGGYAHLFDRCHLFLAQQHKIRKQCSLLALIDPLTEQPNRRSILEFADNAFASAKLSKQSFTVVIIDIDYFKRVNDNCGHDAGAT